MNVVFLDFDEVLNTLKDPTVPGHDLLFGSAEWCAAQLTPERVERLNKIVEGAKACVVLCTSWREVHPQYRLEQALEMAGFRGFVAGSTPVLSSGRLGRKVSRHDEIQAWVDAMHPKAFVILDDMPMGPLSPWHVQPDHGLEEHHIEEALALFKEQEMKTEGFGHGRS